MDAHVAEAEPTPRTEAIVFMLSAFLVGMVAAVSPAAYPISFVLLGYCAGVGGAVVFISGGVYRILTAFLPAALFLLVQYASGLWGVSFNGAMSNSFMFTSLMLFGLMCFHSAEGGHMKGLFTVAGVVLLFASAYAIYQYAAGFERSAEYIRRFGKTELGVGRSEIYRSLETLKYKRVFSTFMSPNVFASFIVSVLPLSVFQMLRAKSSGMKTFHGVCIAAGLVALLLTRSVGGMLALAVCVLVFAAVAAAASGPASRKKALAVIGLAVVVMAVAGYAVVSSRTGGFMKIQTSVSDRMNYWSGAAGIMAERPLYGFGAGSFGIKYLGHVPPGGSESRYAHNIFLQTMAETGIAGLAALVILLASIFGRAAKGLNGGGDPLLFGALAGSCAGFIAHNLVDFTFYLPSGALVFWMCFGVLASVSRGGETSPGGRGKGMSASGAASIGFIAIFLLFFGMAHMARQKVDHAVGLMAEAGTASSSDARRTPPPPEALELAKRAVELKPYDDGMHAFLAGLYEAEAYRSGQAYAELAKEEYHKAIELNPDYPYHYRDLGILYLKLGDKDLAEANLDKALSLYPNSRNLKEIKQNIES